MPDYSAILSTNEIFRGEDTTRFLTQDLEAIESDISDLEANKAPANHTHEGYASAEHTHTGFASANHEHTGYAAENHTHSGYAPTDHTHTGYAPSSHTHDGYFAKTGGDIDGNVNIKGVVRANGKQMIFDSGTMSVFGTNNQATQIAGSQVYSSTAITVSSDERLKRDIHSIAPLGAFLEFVNRLYVVGYNYKADPEDAPRRIGLIAQEVQAADHELAKFFVNEDETGMLGLKTADLVFPLIAAIQCLSAEIDELREKLHE